MRLATLPIPMRDPVLVPACAAVPIVAAAVSIPESHQDLLVRPIHGVLSTMKFDRSTPDGQPQSSLVRVDYDGTYVLINTTLGRQKCRNMQANPKVTLLGVDPDKTDRWIEVPGQRDLAILHLHALCARGRIIGKVNAQPGTAYSGLVTIKSIIGASRIVDMLSGEQLPRIC